MVKALAAGAVMVAAALPMAVATEAGAATTPGTISAVSVTGTTVVQGTAVVSTTVGSPNITVSSVTPLAALAVGSYVSGSGIPSGTTLQNGTTSSAATTATNIVAGSNTVTVASATNLVLGEVVAVPGFPAGSTITAINSTSLTLSANANTSQPTSIAAGAATIANGAKTLTAVSPATYAANNVVVGDQASDATTADGITANDPVTAVNAGNTVIDLATNIVPTPTSATTTVGAVTFAVPFTAASGQTVVNKLSANATATTTQTVSIYTTSGTSSTFGQGASGVMTITGTGLADNGGSVTVTSNAAGMTFTGGSESASTTATVDFTSSATTLPGFYNLTLTDANGATNTLPDAFYVNPAPTVTSLSTPILLNSSSAETITGTGFVPGTTVVFTSSVDGTTLLTSFNYSSPTTLIGTVSDTNAFTNLSATSGAYTATVTNPDGGTSTSGTVLTLSGPTITSVSPSYLAIPSSGSVTTTVTITGTGFVNNALVSLTGGSLATISGAPTYSATSITVPVTVSAGVIGQAYLATVIVANPGTGGTATATDGLGIGEASTFIGNAPTVTATSSFTVTNEGTGLLVITGTGFAPSATVQFFVGTSSVLNTGLLCNGAGDIATFDSTTTITCAITTTGGLYGGPVTLTVTQGAGVSNKFANALTVAGPVITSISPALFAADTLMGTITVTGTGFTNTPSTTSVAFTGDGSATGTVNYVSSTQLTITTGGITGSAGPYVMTLINGGLYATAAYGVGTNPAVTSVSYATNTTGVGIGAVGQVINVIGSGFYPGSTVTFAGGVITGVVKAVTSSELTVAVTVPNTVPPTVSTGLNAFTVTNTNGGAYLYTGLNVQPGIGTTTSVPTGVKGGATTTVTLTGSGFLTGVTVSSSVPVVTVGTVTVVNSNTITVPVTVPVINGPVSFPVILTVANLNGGSNSATLTVNPGAVVTGVYYVAPSSTNLQVSINGSGFEQGMTVASSNVAYTVSLLSVNLAGTVATLLVTTTSAAIAGTFSTVTFTNPDGGAVTFALNGGTAPTPVVVVTYASKPKITSVTGFPVFIGKWTTLTIHGANLAGMVASSNGASVKKLNGGKTLVKISVKPTAGKKAGVFTLTLRTAHGSATYKYSQKKK
jgi:hypothetical protein